MTDILEVPIARRPDHVTATESAPEIFLGVAPYGFPERLRIRNCGTALDVSVVATGAADGHVAIDTVVAPYAVIDESLKGGFAAATIRTTAPGSAPVIVERFFRG